MSSVEVRWLLLIPKKETPMHSTKVAQSASKPEDVWQQVLWEINSQQIQTTEVKSQEMMGGEDLFLSLLRLLFWLSRDSVELLRTALSTVTRQGEDPFDGVGCSNYPAIVGVVRTFAQAQSDQWFNMVQHCQHFLRAFFFHETCNQTSQTCDSHDFPIILPVTLLRTTPLLEHWSSTATWIRCMKQAWFTNAWNVETLTAWRWAATRRLTMCSEMWCT